jgi:hypothetical protein
MQNIERAHQIADLQYRYAQILHPGLFLCIGIDFFDDCFVPKFKPVYETSLRKELNERGPIEPEQMIKYLK